MALTHLQQVLEAAGLPADQVKTIVELKDDAPDFKADTYVAPLHTSVQTKLLNDANFFAGITKEQIATHNPKLMGELESNQYARGLAVIRTNLLKASGLSEADFKELGEDGKKIEVFTPAFAKKLKEGKVTDTELQTKLIEANTKIEELTGKQGELEKTANTKAEATINERTFDLVVLSTLAQIPGIKSPELVAPGVIQKLKSQYGYKIDGLTAELRQKDKPDLKVTTNNGTKVLTLADAIVEMVKDLVEKPKGGTTRTDGKVTITTSGDDTKPKITTKVNDKIQDRINRDKKASGATA